MSSFPASVIIPIAVAIAMHYLNKQSKKDASFDADGNTLLLLPAFYGILGLAATGLGFGLLLFGLFDFKSEDIAAFFGLFLLFAGLGTPLILYRYVYKVVVTPQGLVERTIFGKSKSINWSAINTVKYNAMMMKLTVSDGITTLSCYAHLVGFNNLTQALEMHLKKTRAEMGIPVL